MQSKKPEERKFPGKVGTTMRPSPPRPSPSPKSPTPFELEAGSLGSPENPEDLSLSAKAGLTGSPDSEILVDPKVAGGLLELGFDLVNAVMPEFPPLDQKEVDQMADPFAKFLVDQGWEKIAQSSIIFFARLGSVGFKHYRIAMRIRKAKKNAPEVATDPGHGEARPGQDDASKTDNPRGV